MNAQGKITEILPMRTGISQSGNEWKSITFAIETNEQYPTTIAFDIFGKRIDDCQDILCEGNEVAVTADVSSRRSEREPGHVQYFTSLRVYKMEAMSAATTEELPKNVESLAQAINAVQVNPSASQADLPF